MMRAYSLWVIVLGSFVLLFSPPPTDGIVCYDCIHSKITLDVGLNTTCTDPFQAAGVATTTGVVCVVAWVDFKEYGFIINRTAVSDVPAVSPDQCLMMNQMQKQFKFYLYKKDFCCFDTVQPYEYNGTKYQVSATVCLCVVDKCNGVVQNYITRLPSTTTGTGTLPPKLPPTTIAPTTVAAPVATAAVTQKSGNNDGGSTQPVAMLLFFVMTAGFYAVA